MPNSIAHNSSLPSLTKSEELFARTDGLIPAWSQTLAKGPTQYVRGVAPMYIERGKDAHVWDVDGNEYIDLTMGVGPVSLGYAYPAVDEAIKGQLTKGISFSLVHPLEVEVSELIRDTVPNAERVRFSKTGCDVTSAAVRLARAFTKREKVLCCGYHGWHDWYVSNTGRSLGVPWSTQELSHSFDYNDIDSLKAQLNEEVACVIMEPTIFAEPKDGFLQRVQQECRKVGALLVFDEMWTGFRVATGGAQARWDVLADLACFSKAIANGMPLSVLTGRHEVMQLLQDDVFFFTTFGGEALSLAAAKATIQIIREKNVCQQLEKQGQKLRDGYNAIARELGLSYTQCGGLGCRSIVTFDGKFVDPLLAKSLLQQELIRSGILWSGFHNMCYRHTDADVQHVLEAYGRSLRILKRAVDNGNIEQLILGTPVQPVFRKTK